MPVAILDQRLRFPPVDQAEEGLLAIGGDLHPDRLLLAYRSGIFPWYSEGEPILWHSPDPRFVLRADELHVPRSLQRTLRAARFEIRLDTCFDRVIEACAATPRRHEDGTWITDEIREAYGELHRLGYAHSVEAWRDGELAGGLYGVSLGAAFFGESMFAWEDDASKVAFVTLARQLARWEMPLIDCQIHTRHLERFGAHEVSRARYVELLARALERPTREGRWHLDETKSGS